MWLGANAMPQILPRVASVQAQFSKGPLKLVNEANYMVRLIHEKAKKGIRILRHQNGR